MLVRPPYDETGIGLPIHGMRKDRRLTGPVLAKQKQRRGKVLFARRHRPCWSRDRLTAISAVPRIDRLWNRLGPGVKAVSRQSPVWRELSSSSHPAGRPARVGHAGPTADRGLGGRGALQPGTRPTRRLGRTLPGSRRSLHGDADRDPAETSTRGCWRPVRRRKWPWSLYLLTILNAMVKNSSPWRGSCPAEIAHPS